MNMPSGHFKIEAQASGFQTSVYSNTPYNADRPQRYSIQLSIASSAETVEVTSAAPAMESQSRKDRERDEKKAEQRAQNIPSANVLDLQKRVAGVLPVRVDVPRAGNSYRFARALVLDEETKVTFSYKTSAKK